MILPFSSIKLFETKNFPKNSRIPLRKFSALWDIKISTENCDKPPPLSIFFFDTKKFPKIRRVPLQIFSFGSCETKNFDKTVMPPSLLCMKILDERIFLKHQSVLQWNISAQSDKNFDRKSWYPPLLSIKYFTLPEIFWNTEWFPGEVFSVLWDKKFSIFDKSVELPPSFAWNFSIPELFRNTEGFFYEFYRYCETFFRNTEGFSYEFYRYCETKIFQRSLVISSSYA